MSKYPEHDKMHAIKDQSQAIGEFLEWCGERRWQLVDMDTDFPVRKRTEELLAEFFEIDLKKVEEEKLAMLASLRKAHEGREG